jgi:aquaporin Z
MGTTDNRAPQGFAPIAIGLDLTLIHLISIPVTNTLVNPARSTGVAIFQGDWAISQLWLFWLAPIAGAILAGIVYRWFEAQDTA